MKIKLLILLLISTINFSFSQEEQLGIDYFIREGLSNNDELQSSTINKNILVERIKKAKHAFYPNLRAGINNSVSFGRFLDPYSNKFSSQSNYYNSVSLSSNWTVYSGNKNRIQLKIEKLQLEKENYSIQEKEIILKEEIVKTFTTLSMLKESLIILENRIALIQKESATTTILYNAGKIRKEDLLEINKQLYTQKIIKENIQNQIITNLNYMTFLTTKEGITIKQIGDVDTSEIIVPDTNSTEYQNHPAFQRQQLSQSISEKNIRLKKSYLHPTVSLYGSVYSGYSEGNQRFDPVSGSVINYPFVNQFNDNRYEAVSLNIGIPIYSNRVFRSQINEYKLRAIQETHLVNSNNKELINQYKNEFETVKTSVNLYNLNNIIENDNQEIFRLSQEYFESGKIDVFEYLYKKEQLFKSQEDLIKAKYLAYLNKKLFHIHFKDIAQKNNN